MSTDESAPRAAPASFAPRRTPPVAAVARPRRGRALPTAAESMRPPRYRLLTAAAALPRRAAAGATQSFERECPGCGQVVVFTQTQGTSGVDYTIEEHLCRDGLITAAERPPRREG